MEVPLEYLRETLKRVDSSLDITDFGGYKRHYSAIDVLLEGSPYIELLYTYKHSVHIDYVDAGVKRGHHYLEKRLNDYKKAFSDNCIAEEFAIDRLSNKEETNSKKRQSGQFMSGIWEDMNNNILSSLLVPIVVTKAGTMSVSAEVLNCSVRPSTFEGGPISGATTMESKKCGIKIPDSEGLHCQKTVESKA